MGKPSYMFLNVVKDQQTSPLLKALCVFFLSKLLVITGYFNHIHRVSIDYP